MKQNENKVSGMYDAALYLRLSRDDVDIDGSAKTESNSISSQREMLRNFVRSQQDIQIFDIYMDDGYSGSNFDRPEFKRMTSDIESGKVNCVIVKDLSRFGRDYIEAGRLIQKIYPAFHVRFIAITDNYDSLTADMTESSLVVPIKNFVNDSYCRDISGKVRSQQSIKRENGDFIGAFAPFGYEKSERNRNQLVIDDYASDIVKKIFAWKIEGLSLGAIASRLNSLHILCPKQYKLSKGVNFQSGFECTEEPKWSASQVKRILTNEVYIGTMVQGKQERISYKVKKRLDKPESEWIKVENTHEGIIREADFLVVQKLLKYDGRASKTSESGNLFAGYLFCGDCGAPMIRRVNKYKGNEKVFYICQTKNKGDGCTRHSIPEETLKTIVLKEIQTYSALFMDYDAVMQELQKMEVGYEQIVEYDTQIAEMQAEYNRFYALRTSLYDDLKEGLIGKEEFEEFRKIYGEKCDQLQQSIEGQKQIIKNMFQSGVAAAVQLGDWKKSLELKELDRNLLASAIDRISVYENKHLEVVLRYQNVIEKMRVMSEFFTKEVMNKKQFREVG
ncbi:recombinase family protein [[Clostridium] scindens]|uniref:recombinase family protein n=1 Tax=Clostridium scindens (strain JCM 10418 / VPI 12708) TaxID=29347 RepID=UPI002430248E|nr:recombinase family protein [[Clostridium] scindens]